jgi:hypothetical protein
VETGWTGVKTGWTGFGRLCVRAVSQRRSLHRQSRRLCCQSGRKSTQSATFSARFYCSLWRKTGWTGFITGWTGFGSVDQPTPPLFLLPFLLSLLTHSLLPAAVAYIFSVSTSHFHHKPKPICAIKSLGACWKIRSSRLPPSPPSLSLEFLWFNLQIEVLPYFFMFLLNITRSWLSSVSFQGYILV